MLAARPGGVPRALVSLDFYDGSLSGWLECGCCHVIYAFSAIDWTEADDVRLFLVWRTGVKNLADIPGVRWLSGSDAGQGGRQMGVVESCSRESLVEQTRLQDLAAAIVADPYWRIIWRGMPLSKIRSEFRKWPYAVTDGPPSGDLAGQ